MKFDDFLETIGKFLWPIVLAAAGIFFLASGFQSYGVNWFQQFCGLKASTCIHPEWLAVGAALLIVAFLVYKRSK
jgi:hypothetical protein